MLSSYFSLNTIVELICFTIAIICLTRDKDLTWRLMILLLVVIYFGETFGRFIYMNKIAESNHWVYNIIVLFQIGIMHVMCLRLFRQYSIPAWLLITGLAASVFGYVYDMLNTGFYVYSDNSYIIFSICIVIYGFVYYYHLLTDENYIELKVYPQFWWVAGILLFSFGSITSNLFNKHLNGIMIGEHHLTYYIFRTINVILYSFWSFSFICRKWLYKPENDRIANGTLA